MGPCPLSCFTCSSHPFPSSLSTRSLPLTHHQLCKADVKLLRVRNRTGELHVLQGATVPEVDLREVAAPKAAQEAQAMATPLAGGHGHHRPGDDQQAGALGPHCDLGRRRTESTEWSGVAAR